MFLKMEKSFLILYKFSLSENLYYLKKHVSREENVGILANLITISD